MEQETLKEVVSNIECSHFKLQMIMSAYTESSLLHEWLEETSSYLSTALELCEDYIED